MPAVFGTFVNAGAILAAGLAALGRVPDLPVRLQRRLQGLLGILTLALAFHVVWRGIGAVPGALGRTLGFALLAFVLGRWTGGWLKLQSRLNRLGQFAGQHLTATPDPAAPSAWPQVFSAATVIFCLTPLAAVGPMLEALADDRRVLGLKALLDALATFSLARSRGPGVVLGAVPVLALQGTLTLGLAAARPALAGFHGDQILCATGGLILLPVALVMLQVLRVRLADYLPAAVWAPLLAWLFHRL